MHRGLAALKRSRPTYCGSAQSRQVALGSFLALGILGSFGTSSFRGRLILCFLDIFVIPILRSTGIKDMIQPSSSIISA